MKVLVACEFSGVVRDAFTRRGHDAWSCDFLESTKNGQHLQGDVLKFLDRGWNLMIAHPPCTYLANSGVHLLHRDQSRWTKLDQATELFNALLNAPIKKICVENPVPHKYALKRIVERDLLSDTRPRKYSQLIQPYQFGHQESKAVCLWLNGLQPLIPTSDLKAKTKALPKSKSHRILWMSKSPNRWKDRSVTYEGIAQAMAEQWGT